PELVDVSSTDAAPLGDPLGGLELVGQIDVPRLGSPVALRARISAEPDPAHRFDAAGNADVDGTRGDEPRDQMIGLLPAAALAVDGGGADVLGQANGQPGRAGDVVGLLGILRHAAADDLLDVTGIDAGLLHKRLLHRTEQFGGMQARQPSVAFPDRAAGGFDNYRLTHAARLEHVSLL